MKNDDNPLRDYFHNNTGNAIHKWDHYFDIYHRHFARYRNKPLVILEIGVFQGGSINMWKDYFGPLAKVFAIDINPLCKQFESEQVKIFIGSQEDRAFLRTIKNQIPPVDILIDDGGHSMQQQIVSFEELFDHVKDDGIYLVEDLLTSYWQYYGGGYKNKDSFVEYSKSFIDLMHAWHSEDGRLKVSEFTKSVFALHYYNNILVIEKKKMNKPWDQMIGEVIIDVDKFSSGPINQNPRNSSIIRKLKNRLKKYFMH